MVDKVVDGPDVNARSWRVLTRSPDGTYQYEDVSFEQAVAYTQNDPAWRSARGLPGPTFGERLKRLFFW